jgi:streptomycin 6-kinase
LIAAINFPPVPLGARRRLEAHYGPGARDWIDALPERLAAVSAGWGLRLLGYHDAGHASVIATAASGDGRLVAVKAWPEPQRYAHEIAALRLWYRHDDAVVRAQDDELAMAALVMVGDRPGGALRPMDESRIVADALHDLHQLGRRAGSLPELPTLRDHLADVVVPRIRDRAATTRLSALAQRALPWAACWREDPARTTVLHTDLYRENVPFAVTGGPVFIDPLPMLGDACFDWAFWTVYYRVGQATGERFRNAVRAAGLSKELLLPWCVRAALDGLLYYEATGDLRLPTMANTLSILVRHAERSTR